MKRLIIAGLVVLLLSYTTGNFYLNQTQQEENAAYIYDYLIARGWSSTAICGMLGNMEVESTINPGIWQSLDYGNLSVGYGLVQWTPASKYTNWADANSYSWTDMDPQLERLQYEIDNNLQWIATSAYPLSFADFKVSTASARYLAEAFVVNYERPASPNLDDRGDRAEEWYALLDGRPGAFQIMMNRRLFLRRRR